ncbi:MAG: adenylosuccinate synthetase [Thermoplasmataceae archaeon]
MINRIILLSGQISSGKSALSEGLSRHYQMKTFKTSEYLKNIISKDQQIDRKILQDKGDKLDVETGGKWVIDALEKWINLQKDIQGVIVDSVRIKEQIAHINEFFGPHVTHIHLTAPKGDLEHRFKTRQQNGLDKEMDYNKVKQNQTEKQIEELSSIADLVIDTKRSTKRDVLTRAISYIDTPIGKGQGYVDVIIGGQYGSEGKGQIAAYLAKEYDLLVRVGGPNAGHSVREWPSKYVYHHLPSGTKMGEKAKLMIGPGAVINTEKLLKEIEERDIEDGRLCIDGQAMIINEQDIENERVLVESIGSTGQGVGSATARRITDRHKMVKLAKDVPELKKYVGNSLEILEKLYKENKRILLEGTQGTGLSLYHGKYPFVTSRDTTVSACLSEAGISPKRVRRVIMVCRTYPIRVENPKGETSGPLRDLTWDDIASRSGHSADELKKAERTSTTNKQRRIGEFEWENIHNAAVLNGATDIALTFTDYIDKKNVDARRFEQLTEETLNFIEEVERVTETRVSLLSTGFNEHSVIDRRLW